MRTRTILASLAIFLAPNLHAQEIPDAPIPRILNISTAPLPAKIMFLTDSAIRVGDVITTYRLLNNPCRCFREADPIAPKGGALLPSVAFQASAGAAVFLGSQLLLRHHHPRFAYMLQAIDIESEMYAVFANNIPLLERSTGAATISPVAAPVVTMTPLGLVPAPKK